MNESEIKRFFYRLGIQLFICYLTDTSDIHGENLIANGEFPELIDLETMPGVACCGNAQSSRLQITDISKLQEFLEKSVIHTGILPTASWGDGTVQGSVNVLHSVKKCFTPFKLPVISNEKSSRITLNFEKREIRLKNCVPFYQGKQVVVQKYVDELCNGFQAAYRITLNEKDLASRLFEPLYLEESRYLIRHTQQYDMYISASLAPEFMKDIKNRIYLLHILKRKEKTEAKYASFFSYELESLLNLEIPIYHFKGKNRHIINGDGTIYFNYLKQSAYEGFQEKLHQLSTTDLKRQQMLIRLSIGCNLTQMDENKYIKTDIMKPMDAFKYEMSEQKKDVLIVNEKNVLMRLARHIADLRIEYEERNIWTRLNFSNSTWGFETAGMNLYDGISGIAVVFAAIISICEIHEFDDLYDQLEEELFRYTDECIEHKQSVASGQTGMFVGEGSVVYAYLLLNYLTGHEKYLDYARKHVQIVQKLYEQDSSYDLLSGNAGWIVVLLKLYQMTAEEKYLSYAVKTGETLWEKKVDMENGCGWLCATEKFPLAGMAHGNSGGILAYARLLKHTKNLEYMGRIERLLEYEDSLYSENQQEWLDLRSQIRRGSNMNAWCHGGSGILLSRISLLELEGFSKDRRIEQDIERGIQCLMRWRENHNICLCHGLSGQYMIMKECGNILGRKGLRAESFMLKQRILELKKIPVQEYYSPSLMFGIGGVAIVLSGLEDILL